MKFNRPFTVKDGKIFDRDGKEVRLWGTNYYGPFNHNFVNITEMGKDIYRSIDGDIEEFKKLGVDVITMHVYDREVSDKWGHLVNNEHMRAFDYLIEKLNQAGICVMITTLVWYNTIQLQDTLTRSYAYWSINTCENFGFSNFYTAHEMLWNEDALKAQEIYLNEFFDHANAFSGKKFYEYENIVAVEVINEADYLTPQRLDDLRGIDSENPYKLQEKQVVSLYDRYVAQSGKKDCYDTKEYFCANIILKYLNRMFGIVDKYFGDTVVKTHIHYHFDTNKYMMQVLADAPVNAVSLTAYTPSYFDSAYNDNYNVFEEMRRLVEDYMPLKSLGKAFICYEFEMPTTLSGNFMAAYGCLFAALGVQIANYFTYTPCDVAEYNPGWLVHYFSMCHTPNKSAAFMAGKAIFEAMEFGTELAADDVLWKGENENLSYEINRSTDHVSVITHNSLIYCGGFEGSCNSCPDYIMGTGNSQYI